MPCILKALIAWIILLVVSGAMGLFLRQALVGILVPFPPESENAAVAAALRNMRRGYKRAHIANTIVNFVVSAAYL
jgi:cytoskeletal protein RodZ